MENVVLQNMSSNMLLLCQYTGSIVIDMNNNMTYNGVINMVVSANLICH
jgi:uncharacterized protein (DUF2147 family)